MYEVIIKMIINSIVNFFVQETAKKAEEMAETGIKREIDKHKKHKVEDNNTSNGHAFDFFI